MTRKLIAVLLSTLLALSFVICLAEPASELDPPPSQAAPSMTESPSRQDEAGDGHTPTDEPDADLTVDSPSSHADDFFAGLSQAWGGLLGMASDAGQAVSEWADESGVTEWAEGAKNDITAWANESGITEWAEDASKSVSDWFRDSGVTEWAEGTAADLQAFVEENGPAVEAWLAQAGEDVKQAWNTLVNAEEHTEEELQEAYETVVQSAVEDGQQ